MKTLLALVCGAALSAAVLWALWRFMGPIGLALGMPVLSVLAIPILDMLGATPRLMSRFVMRKVEGRYVEYRGMSLDIETDAQAVCWVSTSDLRKLLPNLSADPVLARAYPGALAQRGDPRQWRITIEALSQYLAKSTDPDHTRLATWLEKDVALPARNKLARGMLPSR